jgi:hypothetical protein
LVMETGVSAKKTHRSAAGHWQTLSHNVVSSTLKIIWLILKYVIKSMIEFGYYIIEHFAWMNSTRVIVPYSHNLYQSYRSLLTQYLPELSFLTLTISTRGIVLNSHNTYQSYRSLL